MSRLCSAEFAVMVNFSHRIMIFRGSHTSLSFRRGFTLLVAPVSIGLISAARAFDLVISPEIHSTSDRSSISAPRLSSSRNIWRCCQALPGLLFAQEIMILDERSPEVRKDFTMDRRMCVTWHCL